MQVTRAARRTGKSRQRQTAIAIRQSGSQTAPEHQASRPDPTGSAGPSIVARGHGRLAERMLSTAFAHDVRVRTDADLVAVLDAVGVEDDIPPFALAAIGEILGYLYRLNGSQGARHESA